MFPTSQSFADYALTNELNQSCVDVPIMDQKLDHRTETNLATVRTGIKSNEHGKLELSKWSEFDLGLKRTLDHATTVANTPSWFGHSNLYTNENAIYTTSDSESKLENVGCFEQLSSAVVSSSLSSSTSSSSSGATVLATSTTDLSFYSVCSSANFHPHHLPRSYSSNDAEQLRTFDNDQHIYPGHVTNQDHQQEQEQQQQQPIPHVLSSSSVLTAHSNRLDSFRLDSNNLAGHFNGLYNPINSFQFTHSVQEPLKPEFQTHYLNASQSASTFSNGQNNLTGVDPSEERQTDSGVQNIFNHSNQTNRTLKSCVSLPNELLSQTCLTNNRLFGGKTPIETSSTATSTSFKSNTSRITGRTNQEKSPSHGLLRGSRSNLNHASSTSTAPCTTKQSARFPPTEKKISKPTKSFVAEELQNYEACLLLGNSSEDSTTSNALSLSRSSYMCRKCRAHGQLLPVKQHKRNCPFRNCTCPVCSLVNYGRRIVAKQIALYRDQKNHPPANQGSSKTSHPNSNNQALSNSTNQDLDRKLSTKHRLKCSQLFVQEFVETNEDDGPHCRRCRNHGTSNPWKGHKKTCPFKECMCPQCILISLRKSNEKNLREVVQEYIEEHSDKRDKKETLGSVEFNRPQTETTTSFAGNQRPLVLNSYWPGLSRKFQPMGHKPQDRRRSQHSQQPSELPRPTMNEQHPSAPCPDLFSQSYLSKISNVSGTNSHWPLQPHFLAPPGLACSNPNSLFQQLVTQSVQGSNKEFDALSSTLPRYHSDLSYSTMDVNSSLLEKPCWNSCNQLNSLHGSNKSLNLSKGLAESVSETAIADNTHFHPVESQSSDLYSLNSSLFGPSPFGSANLIHSTESNQWESYYAQRLNEYNSNSSATPHHLPLANPQSVNHEQVPQTILNHPQFHNDKSSTLNDLSSKLVDGENLQQLTNFRRINSPNYQMNRQDIKVPSSYRDSTVRMENELTFPNNVFGHPESNTDAQSVGNLLTQYHDQQQQQQNYQSIPPYKSSSFNSKPILKSTSQSEDSQYFQNPVNFDPNVNSAWVRPSQSTMVEGCLLGAAAVAAAEYHSQAHQAAAFAAAAAAAVALHNEVTHLHPYGQYQYPYQQHSSNNDNEYRSAVGKHKEENMMIRGESKTTHSSNQCKSDLLKIKDPMEIESTATDSPDTSACSILKADHSTIDINDSVCTSEFSNENHKKESPVIGSSTTRFCNLISNNFKSDVQVRSPDQSDAQKNNLTVMFALTEDDHVHDMNPNPMDSLTKSQARCKSMRGTETLQKDQNQTYSISDPYPTEKTSPNVILESPVNDWLTPSTSPSTSMGNSRQINQSLNSSRETESSWINTP